MSTEFDPASIIDWLPEERLQVIGLMAQRLKLRLPVAAPQELWQRAEYMRVVAVEGWELLEHNREAILRLLERRGD